MKLTLITSLIVFALTWWVVLFAVLPFGVQTDLNPEAGSDPGAPKKSQMGRKFLITTGITCVIYLIYAGILLCLSDVGAV